MTIAVDTRHEAIVSLLMAMDAAHGRSIVLHVGDVPYITTDEDTLPFGSQSLQLAAALTILQELLPAEHLSEISQAGATSCSITLQETPGRVYNIIAARGGDDVWIEIVRSAGQDPHAKGVADISPAEPAGISEAAVTKPAEAEWEPVLLLEAGAAGEASVESAWLGGDLLAEAAALGAGMIYGAVGRPLLARTDAGLIALRDGTSLRESEIGDLIQKLSAAEASGAPLQMVTFHDHAGPGFTVICQKAEPALADSLPARIADLCSRRRGLLLLGGDAARLAEAFGEVALRAARNRAVVIAFSSTLSSTDLPAGFVSVRRGIAPEFLPVALHEAVLQQPDVLLVEDAVDPAVPAMIQAAERTMVVAAVPESSGRDVLARLMRSVDMAPNGAALRDALSDTLLGVVLRTTIRGCDRERRAAYEVIDNGPRLAMAIGAGHTDRVWRDALREKGTETLETSLIREVASGQVPTREAYRRASNRHEFLRSLRRMRRRSRPARND